MSINWLFFTIIFCLCVFCFSVKQSILFLYFYQFYGQFLFGMDWSCANCTCGLLKWFKVFISIFLSHTARRESPRASQTSPSPKNTIIINGRPPSYKGPVSPVSQHDTQPGNNYISYNLILLLYYRLCECYSRSMFSQTKWCPGSNLLQLFLHSSIYISSINFSLIIFYFTTCKIPAVEHWCLWYCSVELKADVQYCGIIWLQNLCFYSFCWQYIL